ncbi:MAG: DUF3048 domain-containing protein [Candidatus Magasanikbacteria bacterium]
MINKIVNNKKFFNIFLVVFVVIVLLAVSYFIWQSFDHKISWKKFVTPPVVFYSSLDGLPVSSTQKVSSTVVGIMIDNHPYARPQSGLLSAKIVYEALVEGGITRYFAIFDSEQNVEKVGPVRSARSYFIDWLQEYGGLYMHCGGSPEALDRLRKESIFDLNEMFRGAYFWRDDNKFAPHNLFTNSENWNKALLAFPEDKNIFNNTWQFGELSSSSLEMVKNISIEYSSDYAVGWQYDENLKNYGRYINGAVEQENQINLTADSVVIQYVKSRVIDDYGRREITTDGQGDLRLLRDGVMARGIWKKENGRTRFYDNAGQELNLKAGKIWVQVVPLDTEIKITA